MDNVQGISDTYTEQIILIQSVTETIVPKLVADDVPLLTRYAKWSCTKRSPTHFKTPVCCRTCSPGLTAFLWTSKLCASTSSMFVTRGSLRRQDFAAVPDSKDSPRSYDGWPLRNWQDKCLAGVAGGSRTARWHRRCCASSTRRPYIRKLSTVHWTPLRANGMMVSLRISCAYLAQNRRRCSWRELKAVLVFDGDVDPEWAEHLNRFVYLRACVASSYRS